MDTIFQKQNCRHEWEWKEKNKHRYCKKCGLNQKGYTIFSKSDCAIPERFMIAMISRGWILRNKIIWYKRNHMPTSVKDRFANSWEYLFMFSKSKRYYFDLDAVREKHKGGVPAKFNIRVRDQKEGRTEQGKIAHGFATQEETKKYDEKKQMRESYLIKKLYDIKKEIRGQSGYEGKSKNIKNWDGSLDNAKSFRDGLEILKKQENLTEEELVWLKDYVQNHFGHPKGKNPDDVIVYEGKYKNKDMKEVYSVGARASIKGEGYNINHPLGKNPSDFWDITTRGYPEAHFAVFPEALVERPIKTTPKEICNKCGKARERITEPTEEYSKLLKNQGEGWSSNRRKEAMKIGNALAEKKVSTTYEAITKGWTSCSCNAGFRPAVILDIFAGSGTTLKVARDLNRDSIGIEIKPDYCKLIEKRLFGGNRPLTDCFKVIK